MREEVAVGRNVKVIGGSTTGVPVSPTVRVGVERLQVRLPRCQLT